MLGFKDFLTEATGAGGFAYEKRMVRKLQKHGLMDPEAKAAGASGDAPDGHIQIGDKTHNLEIKKDHNAMFGQLELQHDGKQWTVSPRAAARYPETANHEAVQEILKKVNQQWGPPSGNYEKDLRMGNVNYEHPNTEPIVAHYHHDRGTPYVQIGDRGLYHFESRGDRHKLGTTKLTGTTKVRARMKYRSRDPKTGKVKYGALIVFSLKGKPQQDSAVNLDDSSHIANIAAAARKKRKKKP